ncbi:FecR family protein [Pinibacter aurantiacus]|uniref:FecR family protein n=1 Tax=Pinibacter aurantiacus TaxID=2851599 RepID=A0A9E2S706_9BACT|nr:FecR family protein [Pinibacter aurantiacus]MBV4355889.1 FecR family protein [Pinibacter aurantiacus]
MKEEQQSYWEDLQNGKQYLPEEQSAEILRQLHQKIAAKTTASGEVVMFEKNTSGTLRTLLRIAAVLIPFLVFSLWYTLTTNHQQKKQVANVVANTNTPAIHFIENGGKSYKEIWTSDGSQIMLGTNSSVEWDDKFISGKRDIKLKGRAWFKVQKDKRPFSVLTNGTVTTALGTQFLVKEINEKVFVQLVEGKVKVSLGKEMDEQKNVYLSPGQEVLVDARANQFSLCSTVDNSSKKRSSSSVDNPEDTVGFNNDNGDISVYKQPLQNLLKAIGKRNNIQFVNLEKLDKNIKVTGAFPKADSIENILNTIEAIAPVSFQKEGERRIQVRPN